MAALPDPHLISPMTAETPLSLVGAAALWSGWLAQPGAVHECPLVIKA